MGVYIEDMEMPSNEPMLVKINPDGSVSTTAKNGYKKYEAISISEPHGRLIDADALKETLDYYIREAGWSDEINKALNWVKDEFINSEPTIIPASEEGEK